MSLEDPGYGPTMQQKFLGVLNLNTKAEKKVTFVSFGGDVIDPRI